MQELKFSEIKMEFDEMNKSELMKLKLWIMRSGNNSHGFPILESALDKSMSTISNKPLVAKYNKFIQDLEGHEVDQVIVGAILTDEDVFFDYDENGVRWLCAYATLWARYAENVAFVMERDMVKNVSIEMLADMNNKKEIEAFYCTAVTIIGVNPSIPNARAEVLEFSEITNKMTEIHFAEKSKLNQFDHSNLKKTKFSVKEDLGKEPSMDINNSKDSAIMSNTWNGQGATFLDSLLKRSNHTSLVKEAYLIVDGDSSSDLSVNDVHYPHHSISDGKLVVNKKGVISAFQRASQQHLSGEAITHIKKHYKELGLSTENFEEGGTNLDEEKDVKMEEEVEMSANENVDGAAQADTLEDEAVQNKEKAEEFVEAKMEDESELKGIGMASDKKDEEESPEEEKSETPADEKKEDFAEVEMAYAKLKEEHTVMMTELENLRKFKAEYDETQKKFAIEETMTYVADVMPEEEMCNFREKAIACEFSELTAWSNEVKARALEFSKPIKKEGFIKMGLNVVPEPTQKLEGIWGKL